MIGGLIMRTTDDHIRNLQYARTVAPTRVDATFCNEMIGQLEKLKKAEARCTELEGAKCVQWPQPCMVAELERERDHANMTADAAAKEIEKLRGERAEARAELARVRRASDGATADHRRPTGGNEPLGAGK